MLRILLSIERRRPDGRDGARGAVVEIDRLLGRLDPTGTDPEPLLADARAIVGREASR